MDNNAYFKSGETFCTSFGSGLSTYAGDTIVFIYTTPKKIPTNLSLSCETTSFWAFAQKGDTCVDVSNLMSVRAVVRNSDYALKVTFDISQTLSKYIVVLGTPLVVKFY